MSSLPRLLRVAIVGAGPSGFFAADALLKQTQTVSIDLIDRLPTPYGLVRYGVAPDHQKIKSVIKLYEKTLQNERVRFFGNVAFGRDLTRADVRRHYDAVVYAVGAPSDRALGIPGEARAGSLSATEFVAWYNGHPDYAGLEPDLSGGGVAVVGMGNVAVDVTRILAKGVDALQETDIADHALAVLAQSRVSDITMLGRRGPAQAKFTTKELRELGDIANADVMVDPVELELDPESEASIAGDPTTKKNVGILRDFAHRTPQGRPRRIHLRFLVSPVEVVGQERVEGLRLEHNRLEFHDGYPNAVGTGVFETIPVGLILRSVGYRGVALPEVPFDTRRNVIPNEAGRVLDAAGGKVVAGEYVAGWIKRGPTGVIGTNKADAAETIKQLVADAETLEPISPEAANPMAVNALLQRRGVCFVSFQDYLLLDQFETAAGAKLGRPRVKVARLQEMLERCGVQG